jgi:hypothetical protein
MAFECFCLIVSFIILKAVEVSVINGVAGCVCPNSVWVTLDGTPLWEFLKHAPTSDYNDDATTFLMTAAESRIEPSSLSAFGGLSPQ